MNLANNEKKFFYDLSLNDLSTLLAKYKIKSYVASQLFNWVYKKEIIDFKKMSNIKKANQVLLYKLLFFNNLKISKILNGDETIKFLFELFDNNYIETVLMKFNYGFSICVSTQVGCNMGCKFCASGIHKKIRDLNVNEIVLQIIEVNKWLKNNLNEKISNVVFMGIGEPFDNFNNLINTIKIITNQTGLDFGARHITVSTCGLCNKIIDFAKQLPQVNLAISLHAPNDEIRNKLMPINNVFNISYLIKTCKDYLKITKRKLTFEYILINDVNDSDKCAMQLIKLLKNMICYVNIIPYNETYLCNFKRSKKVRHFFDLLNKNKLQCTIRLERGTKISAACGQLRIQKTNEKK